MDRAGDDIGADAEVSDLFGGVCGTGDRDRFVIAGGGGFADGVGGGVCGGAGGFGRKEGVEDFYKAKG